MKLHSSELSHLCSTLGLLWLGMPAAAAAHGQVAAAPEMERFLIYFLISFNMRQPCFADECVVSEHVAHLNTTYLVQLGSSEKQFILQFCIPPAPFLQRPPQACIFLQVLLPCQLFQHMQERWCIWVYFGGGGGGMRDNVCERMCKSNNMQLCCHYTFVLHHMHSPDTFHSTQTQCTTAINCSHHTTHHTHTPHTHTINRSKSKYSTVVRSKYK